MKSYFLYIIALCFIWQANIAELSAQRTQNDWCATPPSEDALARVDIERLARSTSIYSVRIFVHIVNETNGTGGVSKQAVYDELKLVQEAYDPFICLYLVGIDEINNSFYTSNWSKAKGQQLAAINSHSGAIDAYILPTYTNAGGNAYAIPNIYFTMGGDRFGLSTFAHELGHCLGLYHTHETVFGNELVDGSNCSSAGDKVCDTPADPQLGTSNVTFPGCTYNGTTRDANNDLYNPDTDIIMSYAVDVTNAINCRDRFSGGQFSRMMATLLTGIPQVLASSNDQLLYNQTISSGEVLRSSIGTIIAGDVGALFSGDYIVQNSAYVTHTAGDNVLLRPGFEADPNISGFYLASVRNALCNDALFISALTNDEKSNISSWQMQANISEQVQHKKAPSISELEIKAFPNPFKDHLNIEILLPHEAETSIAILNTMGQIVQVIEHNTLRNSGLHQLSIPTNRLANGIYYCRIQMGDKYKVDKLVKAN